MHPPLDAFKARSPQYVGGGPRDGDRVTIAEALQPQVKVKVGYTSPITHVYAKQNDGDYNYLGWREG